MIRNSLDSMNIQPFAPGFLVENCMVAQIKLFFRYVLKGGKRRISADKYYFFNLPIERLNQIENVHPAGALIVVFVGPVPVNRPLVWR